MNPESIKSMMVGQMRILLYFCLPTIVHIFADLCAVFCYNCYQFGFFRYTVAVLRIFVN
jgi:hypothetical protein